MHIFGVNLFCGPEFHWTSTIFFAKNSQKIIQFNSRKKSKFNYNHKNSRKFMEITKLEWRKIFIRICKNSQESLKKFLFDFKCDGPCTALSMAVTNFLPLFALIGTVYFNRLYGKLEIKTFHLNAYCSYRNFIRRRLVSSRVTIIVYDITTYK